jgi:hypothetical protein
MADEPPPLVPKAHPITDALASIFLFALLVVLAAGVGFAAYRLMR